MQANDPAFRTALETLRQHTRSASTQSLSSLLVRAVATSRHAAAAVVKLPLRTRAERREAVVAAAAAIASTRIDESQLKARGSIGSLV